MLLVMHHKSTSCYTPQQRHVLIVTHSNLSLCLPQKWFYCSSRRWTIEVCYPRTKVQDLKWVRSCEAAVTFSLKSMSKRVLRSGVRASVARRPLWVRVTKQGRAGMEPQMKWAKGGADAQLACWSFTLHVSACFGSGDRSRRFDALNLPQAGSAPSHLFLPVEVIFWRMELCGRWDLCTCAGLIEKYGAER